MNPSRWLAACVVAAAILGMTGCSSESGRDSVPQPVTYTHAKSGLHLTYDGAVLRPYDTYDSDFALTTRQPSPRLEGWNMPADLVIMNVIQNEPPGIPRDEQVELLELSTSQWHPADSGTKGKFVRTRIAGAPGYVGDFQTRVSGRVLRIRTYDLFTRDWWYTLNFFADISHWAQLEGEYEKIVDSLRIERAARAD